MFSDLDFEKGNGLIPVIAQDAETKEVLMQAYTDLEAFQLSQKTGEAHYYSRSKDRIWKKGESSGNVQKIKAIYVDCDNDSLLYVVEQVGEAACHMGYRSCYFRKLVDDKLVIQGAPLFDPEKVYRS